MNSNIAVWARTCIPCQKAKVSRHTASPIMPFMLPDRRFDQVHVDIVGPLSFSQGQRYILICVDRFTGWPEAIPIPDIQADTGARAFSNGWICRFGVASVITTDRGRQFESRLWTELCQLLAVKRHRTTAYHPQSNGMAERFHRQLKEALRTHNAYPDWMAALHIVLLGVRTAIKVDLSCSSSELVYVTTLRLPGEYCAPSAQATCSDIIIIIIIIKSLFSEGTGIYKNVQNQ